jgi:hypothetical protein
MPTRKEELRADFSNLPDDPFERIGALLTLLAIAIIKFIQNFTLLAGGVLVFIIAILYIIFKIFVGG